MNERLQWMALGIALASGKYAAEMRSRLKEDCFDYGPARRIWNAVQLGREAVVVEMGRVGVHVAETEKVYEAIMRVIGERGRREANQRLADAIVTASRIMPNAEFERYLAETFSANGLAERIGKQVDKEVAERGE